MSRSRPTLAELERQLEVQQREFMAEAERVNTRTSTEEELRALDAKALPIKALMRQIQMLRPAATIRRELEHTRLMEREVATTDLERALFRENGDELEALLARRLQEQAVTRLRLARRLAVAALVVVGLVVTWRLLG